MNEPIKISLEDAEAIEVGLRSANGKATNHVLTTVAQIIMWAERCEKKLESIQIPQDKREGAVFKVTAEKTGYRFGRKGTVVQIVRGPVDWFLISARREEMPRNGRQDSMKLTTEQDASHYKTLNAGLEQLLASSAKTEG
ncbi:MAG: hypothetical protein V4787_02225 [Pseudomonadota bacterium]